MVQLLTLPRKEQEVLLGALAHARPLPAHHVHNHDATTDKTIRALGEGILEIDKNLRNLQNHVNVMAAQAEKWINSTGRNQNKN